MAGQTAIPCTMMRGGTSRGPYFLARELPADEPARDRVLLAAMGSPDHRQIDGMGGATTLTSKVAIVSPSAHDWAQVDYLFAQVSVERAFVDYGPTCGNMLAGVAPFAIDRGLVAADDPRTVVHIRNVNTDSLIEAVVETPGGRVEYDGGAVIDGVPGSAAPILLNFMEVVGSKTGALFPTGSRRERILGVEVSCVDAAMPMVLPRRRAWACAATRARRNWTPTGRCWTSSKPSGWRPASAWAWATCGGRSSPSSASSPGPAGAVR